MALVGLLAIAPVMVWYWSRGATALHRTPFICHLTPQRDQAWHGLSRGKVFAARQRVDPGCISVCLLGDVLETLHPCRSHGAAENRNEIEYGQARGSEASHHNRSLDLRLSHWCVLGLRTRAGLCVRGIAPWPTRSVRTSAPPARTHPQAKLEAQVGEARAEYSAAEVGGYFAHAGEGDCMGF